MSTGRLSFGLLSIVMLASLGVGCRTPDLTEDAPRATAVCEVHHSAMKPEWIPVWSGTSVQRSGYLQAARSQFPHHGIGVYQGEQDSLPVLARQVRVFVCPQCTQTYQEYWNRAHP
jgi:hypothetical protein